MIQAGHQAVTLGDGVVEVCHRSLCTISDVGRQSRYRVYVHLDTEGAWLNGGGVLPKALADKVMCDGVLQPVWLRGGKPVNVGRSQRIVPDRTRRFVVDRDRGCRFPSCGSKYWLEVHHIKHWREGGLTDTYNLVCLCPFHHDGHHRGDFLISGDADDPRGLSFTDPTDALIAAIRPLPQPGQLPGPPDGHWYRHPTGERIDTRWVYFDCNPSPSSAAADSCPPTAQDQPERRHHVHYCRRHATTAPG